MLSLSQWHLLLPGPVPGGAQQTRRAPQDRRTLLIVREHAEQVDRVRQDQARSCRLDLTARPRESVHWGPGALLPPRSGRVQRKETERATFQAGGCWVRGRRRRAKKRNQSRRTQACRYRKSSARRQRKLMPPSPAPSLLRRRLAVLG